MLKHPFHMVSGAFHMSLHRFFPRLIKHGIYETRERIALHVAGQALVACLYCNDFLDIEFASIVPSRNRLGLVGYKQSSLGTDHSKYCALIVLHSAGTAAEEQKYGKVCVDIWAGDVLNATRVAKSLLTAQGEEGEIEEKITDLLSHGRELAHQVVFEHQAALQTLQAALLQSPTGMICGQQIVAIIMEAVKFRPAEPDQPAIAKPPLPA